MNITLVRYCYTNTETLGALIVGDTEFHTIEKPWIKHSAPGGKPFESCIPDGDYRLEPFERTNGDTVYCMVSEELNVWFDEDDRPNLSGRYACLIHSGNWAKDVVGCVALGLGKTVDDAGNPMVTSSKTAMTRFHELLPMDDSHTLTIRSVRAKD